MLSSHIRRNVIGYLALFVALGGTAWAGSQVGADDIQKNAVRSKHVKNGQLKSADVRDNGLTGADVDEATLGEVPSAKRADTATSAGNAELLDSLDSSELQRRVGDSCPGGEAIRAIGQSGGVTCEVVRGGAPSGPAGGDLTGTYPNPQIAANAVGTNEVAPDSLTGADINESQLSGVASAAGESSCCAIRGENFSQATAFDPGDPLTFTDFGVFELRSTVGGDADTFDLCNTIAPAFRVFIYRGGAESSTSETRSATTIGGNSCLNVDFNGADTNGVGDFRLLIPTDRVVATGMSSISVGTLTQVIATSY